MRLVTYDRGGHRRLGAILEGEVVDLPDAVGHPAFPTTLEGLVSSSRGSVMDAARAALQRDDAWNWRVPKPRILTPLFPHSLLSPRAIDVERRIVGPEQPVPWPDGAAWLDYEPMVAAVIGNEASKVAADDVRADVFGYTLVNDWRGPLEPTALRSRSAEGVPDLDRALRGHGRRAGPAGDVRAGEGRRPRRAEGEPQRRRRRRCSS